MDFQNSKSEKLEKDISEFRNEKELSRGSLVLVEEAKRLNTACFLRSSYQ